jgi:hypothetical protein
VLCCSLVPRVFLTWRADQIEQLSGAIPDSTTYLGPAFNLVRKGAFLDARGTPEVARTPGYPFFLAGLITIVGRNMREVLILQSIILSLSVVIIYMFARRTLPPVMAFTGGLLAAFSPWGAVLAGLPLSDGMFVLILALMFLVMKLVEEVFPSWVVVGGAIIGFLTSFAVLVRPVWPLVVLIPGALLFCCGLRRKEVWLLVIVTLVCAATPIELWKWRNQKVAHFNGLSDIPGKTVWRYLAARVVAEATGQDRHFVAGAFTDEDRQWSLTVPVQQAENQRLQQAKAIFMQHPFLTVYSFVRSATEHAIHPSPDVLSWAKLNFHGDFFILGSIWLAMLVLAFFGLCSHANSEWDHGDINRRWLSAVMGVCVLLTLMSGVSFAAGSRLRAPLELIIPFLAATGLLRVIRPVRASVPYTQQRVFPTASRQKS